MKELIKNNAMRVLMLLTILFAMGSCSDDVIELPETSLNEGVFEESEIISFEEIEKMTEQILPDELIDNQSNVASSSFNKTSFEQKNFKGISVERRYFEFNGEVTEGTQKGAVIEGELQLKFTLFHASFAIIRGELLFPDKSKASVRGAWISDGYVYLIIKTDDGYIRGYGMADDEGNMRGRFRLNDRTGKSVGNWTANLISVTTPDQTIVDIVVADERFTSLVGALSAAELVDALNGEGPFTVFAPTNDAFAALESVPQGEMLKQVLLYHVVSGKYRTQKLLKKEMVETLQGENIKISLNENNEIVINDTVKLLQSNIRAKNGIIHVIESVLIPPSFQSLPSIVEIATSDDDFSTLVGALQAADLVTTLEGDGPFTVFAPTNDAFAALDAIPEGDDLKEVLLYHVVSGKYTGAELLEKQTVTTVQGEEVTIEWMDGKVVLNGTVTVVIADIMASNGIVHVIDGVLIPPSMQLPSIVEIATSDDDFSTLVGALQAADLVTTLEGDGPFTVFAPTNYAFEGLDDIPEGDDLKEVLLYHVLAGKYTAEDLLEEQTVTTLQGSDITIQMEDDKIILNGCVTLSVANIEASNGIVHVIKRVLIPTDTH
ncbi:MAG: fasciclin domain-containing protein [Aureibaculum sp.]